jgi:aryl-alcohol dehydrogenase-like predicted oxidoreductase
MPGRAGPAPADAPATDEVMMDTDLPLRPLGTTGMVVTRVGLGAWAIGGGGWSYGWGPQDDDRSIETIRAAAARGVNWVDTAAVYGIGHSEELVGRAVRGLADADRPYVFTKCGQVADRSRPFEPATTILRPDSMRREVEASLRRLGVERIDLLQIHWPEPDGTTPIEESWAEMARFVDEGKVRAIGVSNFDVALLERCERIRHVDSLQPPFSLIRRDAGAEVVSWCVAHRTAVIVYSPMQSGILTDRFSPERVETMAEDDWRRRSPNFNEPALTRNLALRDELRPIAERHRTTVAAVAVAWTLTWDGVNGAIVGARSPEQIDGWIDAATLELDDEDVRAIAGALEKTGAGSGPMRPGDAVAG